MSQPQRKKRKPAVPRLGNTRDKERLAEIVSRINGTDANSKKMLASVTVMGLDLWKNLDIETQILLLEELLMSAHRMLDIIGAYRKLRYESTRRRKQHLWVQ